MSKIEQYAFLGGGNMAEAILGGLLEGGLVEAGNVRVADIASERRKHLARQYGVVVTPDAAEAAKDANVIILAVKPQQVPTVIETAGRYLTPFQLLVSICAGMPLARLEELTIARVMRVMPNLPALVRHGVSAVCRGSRAGDYDVALTETIFKTVGSVVHVPEAEMNAVTALSGSGPGYVFALMEELEKAGLALGLSPDTARHLAVDTVEGAGELAQRTGEDPSGLRGRVSSKGGTTLAGLAALDEHGFATAVQAAVQAAYRRAEELTGVKPNEG